MSAAAARGAELRRRARTARPRSPLRDELEECASRFGADRDRGETADSLWLPPQRWSGSSCWPTSGAALAADARSSGHIPTTVLHPTITGIGGEVRYLLCSLANGGVQLPFVLVPDEDADETCGREALQSKEFMLSVNAKAVAPQTGTDDEVTVVPAAGASSMKPARPPRRPPRRRRSPPAAAWSARRRTGRDRATAENLERFLDEGVTP